jgi:hypothetical protein
MKLRLPGRLLAALLFALPAFAQQTITVTVADGPAVLLPQHAISGFNYGNSMRVAGWEADWAAVDISALRFPPGNVADEHPLTEPAAAALKQHWQLLGEPELTFVLNLFSGSPQETAEAAQLLARLGIRVSLWQIGNEPDLYATNRLDDSWTPERYCAGYREHADALRMAQPDGRLAGPGVSGGRPGALLYLGEVLRHCGDVIDVLTFHIYPTDGTWTDEDALATSRLTTGELRMLRDWLQDSVANPLGWQRNIALGVTEFGLSWRTKSFRHLEDQTATLWLADTLGRLAREGVEVSHYFALQGTGGHGLIDSGGWLRPTYWLYTMLKDFTGQMPPVTITPAVDSTVTAYAAHSGDTLRLLLVNGSPAGLNVELALPSGTAAADLLLETLSEPIFDAGAGPSRVLLAAGEPFPLPARSVAVLSVPHDKEQPHARP